MIKNDKTVWKSAFLQAGGLKVVFRILLIFCLSLGSVKAAVANPATGSTLISPRFLSFSLSSAITIGGDQVTWSAYGIINDSAHTIQVYIPFSASKASLIATFASTINAGVLIDNAPQVSGSTVNNFTSPLTYELKAADGLSASTFYTVTVTKNPRETKKQMVSFSFNSLNPPVGCVIDESAHLITASLPAGTNLTDSLAASFETTSMLTRVKIGTTRQISGITRNNFTNPLKYRVIAEDSTFVEYLVSATVLPASSARQITDFRFNGLSAPAIGTIDEALGSIFVTIPWGADITRLTATFTSSPLSTVMVGTVQQLSGQTVNNFSSIVTYQVTAQNGTFRYYFVRVVTEPPSNESSILRFNLESQFDPDIIGTIDQSSRTIHLVVPYSQDITRLTPSFSSSPFSKVMVGSTTQVSGVTTNDFTKALTYYCVAADGTTSSYLVSVSHAEVVTLNNLLTFRFNDIDPDVIGIVDQINFTITVHLPVSQSVSGLVATFTLSPLAKAFVGGVLQTSGLTANNFTSTVTYAIRAENGSIRYYYLNIVRDPVRTDKVLESFSFLTITPSAEGVINQQTHQVVVHVPSKTNVTALVATFSRSYMAEVKVSDTIQVSGVTARNFTNEVVYKVIAEDGSIQNYSVNVIKDPESSAKKLTDFRFIGLAGDAIGVIDENAGMIIVTVPWSANINQLVATFSNSPLSTVKVGSTIQISGSTVQSFSSPVKYIVTADDSSTKEYSVIVNRAVPAKGNTISTFNFEIQFNPPIIGVIDNTSKTINLNVPYSCDVTGLIPTFTSSQSATVLVNINVQVSGVTPNNFTYPLTYTCRAEDGSAELYTVSVTHSPASNLKEILGFRFNLNNVIASGVIDNTAATIKVHVPFGTDVSYLVAGFNSTPLSKVDVAGILQVSDETPNDFSKPVIYRVTAEDNTEKYFSVSVIVDPNHEKRLYTFEFKGLNPPVAGVINETLKTVQVNVPYSVNRNHLLATFTLSANAWVLDGTVRQTSGETWNDFTQTRLYVVHAQDGIGVQSYSVTVINDPPRTEARISDFRFNGLSSPAVGEINEENGTIRVIIPFGADITTLPATFTNSLLSTVKIGNLVQTSGKTTNNFTSPLTYNVTAENGTIKTYLVTVVKALPSTGNSILSFNFESQFEPDIRGNISQGTKTITLTVPLTQDLTSLVASFASSPFSKVFVGSNLQLSGVTANNFVRPVTYRCEAEDGSVALYEVSVLHDRASRLNDILTFGFDGLLRPANGVISNDGKNITVTVPGETDIKNLVARFTLSPFAVAKVGGATQISGVTPNDFTTRVSYVIVAEDNTEKIYFVTVHVGPNVEKKMLSFSFNNLPEPAIGNIIEAEKRIVVYVPFSTNRLHMVATFTSSYKSVVLIGDVIQTSGNTDNDFNYMRIYSVRAEDGLIQNYEVLVLKSPGLNDNFITAFSFDGLTSPVKAVIDQSAKTIHAVIPYGTTRYGLIPTFSCSLFAAVTVGGIAQISGVTKNDFINPVVYRCTSESGLINEYQVTVINEAGSSEKAITYFAFEDLFPSSIGEIDETGKTITLVVNDGTDISSLRATFESSPFSNVFIEGLGIQTSGVNRNDYTYPVVYHVIAQDGSSADYTVLVNVEADTRPPVIYNASQLVTNQSGQFVVLQSNESYGFVYIVKSNASQLSVADLERAVKAGLGRKDTVMQANTDILISTYALDQGVYITYAVDGVGNKSLPGINTISVMDVIAPDVFMQSQVLSNAPGVFINARSSDNGGYIYIILEGVPHTTKQQLEAAVGSLKGQKAAVESANTDVQISTLKLFPGNYRAFAADVHGNVSAGSTEVSTVTEASQQKLILGYSFNDLTPPVVGQIVGSDIFVTVQPGTPLNSLVGYFSLSPVAKAFVGLVEQTSGVTPNDFTKMVVYTVEAEDGTTTEYHVMINIDAGVEVRSWFNSIRTYPNPFSDRLTVEMTRPASRIQIVNVLNQVVEEMSEPQRTRIVISTSSWESGVYFIRYFMDGQYVGVQKILRN